MFLTFDRLCSAQLQPVVLCIHEEDTHGVRPGHDVLVHQLLAAHWQKEEILEICKTVSLRMYGKLQFDKYFFKYRDAHTRFKLVKNYLNHRFSFEDMSVKWFLKFCLQTLCYYFSHNL